MPTIEADARAGEVLALTRRLIERASTTPDDAGCQTLLAQRLEAAGFAVEHLPFGSVDNLWARRGRGRPLIVLAGHTDVVPAGPAEHWCSPPFAPTVDGGVLRGRGAADMKSSLAAMMVAAERFAAAAPDHGGSLAFLVTSDEEGPAVDGTARVVETLAARGEQIDYCVVGEPSSDRRLGDTIRNGRRGSVNGSLVVRGVQGHVAYPEQVVNPVHRAAPAIDRLARLEWDAGTPGFPATSFQISNLRAGTGAANVVPGELEILFNLRFCPASTPDSIDARMRGVLDDEGLDYALAWSVSGLPFHTPPGTLTEAVTAAVLAVTGVRATLSTGGGTSDGRFIAPTGAEVVEIGPINASIHKIDEHVAIADLEPLAAIYQRTLESLLGRA